MPEVHQGGCFNYVMKEDTREAGPWSDTDSNLAERPPLTRQLRAFLEMTKRPWQASYARLSPR